MIQYVTNWPAQRFKQFTAVIEGQTVHFVHEKSADADAIPIILLHGWPSTFILVVASARLTTYYFNV